MRIRKKPWVCAGCPKPWPQVGAHACWRTRRRRGSVASFSYELKSNCAERLARHSLEHCCLLNPASSALEPKQLSKAVVDSQHKRTRHASRKRTLSSVRSQKAQGGAFVGGGVGRVSVGVCARARASPRRVCDWRVWRGGGAACGSGMAAASSMTSSSA
eukprot:2456790-Pleurochrysis_carterae.AAC.5